MTEIIGTAVMANDQNRTRAAIESGSVETGQSAVPKADKAGAPSVIRNKTLWMLTATGALCFLDRQLVNILAEPIKEELGLSDTQLGLLTGLAFALFYVALGIPIGRIIDKPSSNRVGIISLALVIWSAMTGLCGLAQTFPQLLCARFGVGAGEAASTPAAHSLIGDMFVPERRVAALALYGSGLPVGMLLGMALGGIFADAFGWRTSFLLLGAPGILVGMAIWLLVAEPRTNASVPMSEAAVVQPHASLWATFNTLWHYTPLRRLVAAMTLSCLYTYGSLVWQPIFFIRTVGLSPGEIGVAFGLMSGLSAIAGNAIAGLCAARLATIAPRHVLTVTVLGMLLAAPGIAAILWVDDWRLALVLLVPSWIAGGLTYGPTYAALQSLVRPQARAATTALFLTVQTGVGLGLGPLLFGMLSDCLDPWAGVESVRYVICASTVLVILSGWFYWRVGPGLDAQLLTTAKDEDPDQLGAG